MKMKAISLGLAAVGLFVATAAYAGPAFSGVVNVNEVDAEADLVGSGAGSVYLTFTSAPFTTTCSLNSSGTWLLGGNADSVKAMQSLALGAKLSGKGVRVLFNNTYSGTTACSGGGSTGYPVARGISVQ